MAAPEPTAGRAAPAALPNDRLWTLEEAAAFFGMGEGWVRNNVPAVLLPGDGRRRAVRYLPETCRAFARQHQTSNVEMSVDTTIRLEGAA